MLIITYYLGNGLSLVTLICKKVMQNVGIAANIRVIEMQQYVIASIIGSHKVSIW